MIRIINSKPKIFGFSHICYSYIRKKDIEDIRLQFGSSNFQKIKMYGSMLAHIGKQAFKEIRNDLKLYLEIKKKK